MPSLKKEEEMPNTSSNWIELTSLQNGIQVDVSKILLGSQAEHYDASSDLSIYADIINLTNSDLQLPLYSGTLETDNLVPTSFFSSASGTNCYSYSSGTQPQLPATETPTPSDEVIFANAEFYSSSLIDPAASSATYTTQNSDAAISVLVASYAGSASPSPNGAPAPELAAPVVNNLIALFATSQIAAATSYSASVYPYDCVCYITDSLAQGSGVIIGPHTILTASHVLWSYDLGQSATNIEVYPGYSSGGQSVTGQWVTHFFEVNDSNDQLTKAASQQDFAIIDFSSNLSSYGSFGIQTNYSGGTVHLTGYPAIAGGAQTDQIGTVSADSTYSVLDYVSVSSSPGNSGGPIWINLGTAANPLPYVVGVVSTVAWAVQLTNSDWQTIQNWESSDSYLWSSAQLTAAAIQNDYFAITRAPLPLGQATTEANAINAGTQTETQYVNGLLSQVADTTIPAVAVEASMYGATGTSAEITSLVTNFLPAQVANAIANGYNPEIYACETLGLVFAFGNETGSTAFANNYGPSNPAMPDTTAGDASFAAAAASLIFGSAETSNTVPAIEQWVSNWKAFYTAHGIAVGGVSSNPTAQQIDLAARGAAWGDAIGLALFDNLGPFPGQITNFLEDAAQGTAVYGASLLGQPAHHAFFS
jgi:V8-like Glu-specific endopeptidase